MAQDQRFMMPISTELKAAMEQKASSLGMSTAAYVKTLVAKDLGLTYDASNSATRSYEPCPHGMVKSRCGKCTAEYHKNRAKEQREVYKAYKAFLATQSQEAPALQLDASGNADANQIQTMSNEIDAAAKAAFDALGLVQDADTDEGEEEDVVAG